MLLYALTLNKNWPACLSLASVGMSYLIMKRTHWSVGLLALISCLSGIWNSGGFQVLAICAFAMAWLSVHESQYEKVLVAAGILYIGSIFATLITNYGLSGNPSMNGCLIAILLPITCHIMHEDFKILNLFTFILAIAMIFKVDASIPIGVLAVVAVSYTVALFHKEVRDSLIIGSVLASCIVGLGWIMNPQVFFSDTGRSWMYQEIFKWYQQGNVWFGQGLGTTDSYLTLKRSVDPLYKTVIWAHNDYLQVLADMGVVGLASLLIAMAASAIRAYSRPWLFAASMGYAATMLFNFPMHVPIHAATGCGLLWLIWSRDAQYNHSS